MNKYLFPLVAFVFFTYSYSFSQRIPETKNVDLVGRLTYEENLADIWGYVDENGTEYALVGTTRGLSIVSLKDPASPEELFFIDGPDSEWRDIKTYEQYAYVSNETSEGLLIVDLGDLPNDIRTQRAVIADVRTIHNLWIDEEGGFLYMVGTNNFSGGMVICGLKGNPFQPQLVGVYDGNYVHDVYVRNNIAYAAEIDARQLTIIDVAQKSSPQFLGSRSYPNALTHNTWLNDEGNVCFTTDETSNVYLRAWDVSNPTNIVALDSIRSRKSNGEAIPHNVHVLNDYLVTSYYADGVHITDASQPKELIEIGYYDTNSFAGATANGCWGAYPFLPSGLILASDIQEGLFVLQPHYRRASFLEGFVTDSTTGIPLEDATIELVDTDRNTLSKIAGDYIVGIDDEGAFEVQVIKFGYIPDTVTINLERGMVQQRNFQLQPASKKPYSIRVIELDSGLPIEDANILLAPIHTSLEFLYGTDEEGKAIEAALTLGQYDIFAGKWGYITKNVRINLNESTGDLEIALSRGYADDFIFDMEWEENGTASSGRWERGIPKETRFQNTPINPGEDVAEDFGKKAYVTGNQGSNFFDDDVDNGFTRLSSPVFDLTIYKDPIIFYRWWEINYIAFSQGGQAGNGYLKTEISNGEDTVEVLRINSPFNSDAWKETRFKVADFLPITDQMQIHFTSDDPEPGNIVEGGIDDFKVEGDLITSIEQTSDFLSLQLFPNPVQDQLQISYELINPSKLNFQLIDLQGRRLIEFSQSRKANGRFAIPFPYPSGIYFLQISKDNRLIDVRKLVK